jgi:SAM-dependent methyltransferase
MLRYARKLMSEREKKMIRLVHADMSDMDGVCKPGTVDFSFNMINTIRHLASDAAMLRHLRAIARALKPGGIYVVGMSLSNYEYETESEDRWEGSLGATTVIQNVQYLPAHGGKGVNGRKEKVISQILARRGSQEEHHDDVYFLRSYDLRQWVLLLEKSPLRLIATIDEKGEPIPPAEPGYTLFVLANKSDPRVADAVWHQGVG